MSSLPRVSEYTRERISREFDDLGPEACMDEIVEDMQANNPELLDMAMRCARDVGDPLRAIFGFCMFYRLLTAQAAIEMPQPNSNVQLSPLPRVSPATRDLVVRQIEERGSELFTIQHIEELERHNPGLLQMAHNFASTQQNYLRVMQGIALLWAALVAQSTADRAQLQ